MRTIPPSPPPPQVVVIIYFLNLWLHQHWRYYDEKKPTDVFFIWFLTLTF